MKKNFEKQSSIKLIVLIVILIIIGYLTFRLIGSWHKSVVDKAIGRQENIWRVETDALKEKIAILQEELRLHKDEYVSEEKLFEAFGDDATLIFPGKPINCDVLERQIKSFYRYLDQKDYIKAYHLENGTSGLFHAITKSLSETPPTVIGETRDMYAFLRNLAHFLRVLGKNRLKLIKDILKYEAELIEPAMAIFYARFTADDCKVGEINPPPIDILYKYSGFFLNTIAGHSYLFRRDSKVRTLVGYYSVLILDRANDISLNPYGIDITQFLDSLVYDIGNRKELIYKRQYLEKLEELREKYKISRN